jgi:Ca2+-binding EF-hand superfamily protein
MHRLILCLLTGLTIVFLPQHLLAEDPAGPPGPSKAQPAGPNPEVLFDRLDANHDGFITQAELPQGMPEMFKQLLLLADGNGDGKITKEELTAALNQHRQSPEHDVKADSPFTIISLRYAKAMETAKIIDQVYGNQKDIKLSITVDARLNSLIVRASQTLSDEIQALVQKLDVKTPDSNSPPIGPRFRGPEAQADQMPGPPFGRRFGGPEGRPGEMAGPPFGRQGMGPGRMGGPGGRFGLMAGPSSHGPGDELPQKSAGADGPEGPVQVEAYSITKADPQATLKVMQTLLAGKPDVRMDIDPKTNHLIVLARPAEHATIRATLAELQRDTQSGADAKDKPADMAGPPFGGRAGPRGWMAGQGFDGPGMGSGRMAELGFREPGNGPGWMGGQGFGGGPGWGPRWMADQRSDGPEPGSDRMPGQSFGRPGRGWMGGQGFGGPGMGADGMAGQGFGGPGMGHGWMGSQGFGGPDRGPAEMGGRPFGRGGPDGGPPQMAGRNFSGPNAGPPWMRESHFNGPEQRPWAGPGYGPPHRWAAFEPMQQPPWQQYGHWGPPNGPWQPNGQNWYQQLLSYNARPHHPWMAYGPGQHRPWQPNGQNWYQQLMSYNARLPHQQFNPKALFDRLDTNHDNQLSFEEFSQAMKHLLHAVLPGPGPQWARPVGRFGGQDFGPPGHLAMANYPGSRPKAIEEKITMLFQNFDNKHDGQLTKDEAPPMIQKNFDRIDVDKKGFITPRDLYRAISHLRHRADVQQPVNQGDETTSEKPQAKDKPE